MENMELIRNAVAEAAKRFGAEEYELTISSKEDTAVEALKKEVSTVSYSRSGSMVVRCVVGGKSGYAASELVTPEAAAEIVETACDNATVAVHINRLREKLGDAAGQIKTVIKSGYKLEA